MRYLLGVAVAIVAITMLLGSMFAGSSGVATGERALPISPGDLHRISGEQMAGKVFRIQGTVAAAWRVGNLVVFRLSDSASPSITVIRVDGVMPRVGQHLTLIVEVSASVQVSDWHGPLVFVVRSEVEP